MLQTILLDSSINMLCSRLKKDISNTKKMMLGWKLIIGIN